jgi:hypothetical protein
MKREYLCPHCNGRLSPSVKIILRAESRGQQALFLFSPRPGNYDVIIPHGFRLRKGEEVKFSCPICSHDLASSRDPDMVEIRFEAAGGCKGTVVFSREYGHHETYFVTKEEVRSYGEHAAQEGINFWGAGPKR